MTRFVRFGKRIHNTFVWKWSRGDMLEFIFENICIIGLESAKLFRNIFKNSPKPRDRTCGWRANHSRHRHQAPGTICGSPYSHFHDFPARIRRGDHLYIGQGRVIRTSRSTGSTGKESRQRRRMGFSNLWCPKRKWFFLNRMKTQTNI